MLQTQVNYWQLQEQQRHNLATEQISQAQLAAQRDYWQGSLAETHRANVVKEGLTAFSNISGRTQAESSMIQAAAAAKQADVAESNALTRQREADIAQQRADTAQFEANIASRRADIADTEARTAQKNADTRRMEANIAYDEYMLDAKKFVQFAEREMAVKESQALSAARQAEVSESRNAWEREVRQYQLIFDALSSAGNIGTSLLRGINSNSGGKSSWQTTTNPDLSTQVREIMQQMQSGR